MRFLSVLSCVLTAGGAFAQSGDGTHGADATDKRKYEIGIDAGVYLPTQRQIQDVFGNAVYKFGLDFGTREAVRNGRFVPSMGLISAHRNGNSFYLGQALLSYEIRLAQPQDLGKRTIVEPFGRASIGAAYADYSITNTAGVHFGAKRILPTGQLEAGVYIGPRVKVTAAYDFFESVDGFNFNGFSLSVAYTLFRF